ncbi:uncharacterized protein LOC110035453 isoform X2 [Phalaenopsis equestris]|uniref:uncharacterized protein LOC110035453 isoform X2 n=1 Tax=Phalaenopsis equestris TaxID=78828 RepID=UPI0009E304D4|nr:uncharacterized protein LOC110035453 isoform X2 [Phalaenopsis equestris]
MEPVAFVVGRFKEFGRSTERFVDGVLQKCRKRASHRPIEILKRLQREAFSDLMKLRERQDKVERILSFNQSGKGGPFQEARTHMKGVINVDEALMFTENDYERGSANLDRAGTRRGIDLRFIFETSIRQRDLLIAEFLATHCSLLNHSYMNQSPLVLSKLVYFANICDSLSAVFTPFRAQCTEFGTTSFQQVGYESRSSFFYPPLFHQSEGCGLGFIVKRANLAASLAGLVSGPGEEASSVRITKPRIFGQVSYKPSEESRLTMSGIWQTRRKKRTALNSFSEGCSSDSPNGSTSFSILLIALVFTPYFHYRLSLLRNALRSSVNQRSTWQLAHIYPSSSPYRSL